jgi:hypothetical protein
VWPSNARSLQRGRSNSDGIIPLRVSNLVHYLNHNFK